MFFLCVPSFLSLLVSIIKQINIYINLIIKTIIIITIIILGIFSCPCVLSAACGRCRTACPSVSGWCVPGGSRGLLKLSQVGSYWKPGKYWQTVSEVERCWGFFCRKNNGRTAMATFDNLYRKCYNKRSDNNKNVICHQTGKFALYGVFPL